MLTADSSALMLPRLIVMLSAAKHLLTGNSLPLVMLSAAKHLLTGNSLPLVMLSAAKHLGLLEKDASLRSA